MVGLGKVEVKWWIVKRHIYKMTVGSAYVAHEDECWNMKTQEEKSTCSTYTHPKWMCGATRKTKIRNDQIRVNLQIAPT